MLNGQIFLCLPFQSSKMKILFILIKINELLTKKVLKIWLKKDKK